MCGPGQQRAALSGTSQALAALEEALAYLAEADAAALTTSEQADCLRGLEEAEAQLTAARACVLTAFAAQGGCEDDGHGSARTWLKWQTRITSAAAAAALAWARRLGAHPAVRETLAAAQISASWAKVICDWTDRLPGEVRADADQILLAAAASGAELADLASLAEEIRRRTARPDRDGDGFADRWVRLETTFAGAGRLAGDLTPGCAAALHAVLDALGKKAGPEDARTKRQREHDALEEACRRLIASGCLPQRAGQPTHIQLTMKLDQLRGLNNTGQAGREPVGWPGATAGPGAECDATIIPVVTGHVDPGVLDRLVAALLHPDARDAAAWAAEPGPGPDDLARRQRAARAVRQMLIQHAADLLSGPQGLAAWLRSTRLFGPPAAASLPLDVGVASETIPSHLRRAVSVRDQRCRFPGCDQPSAACQPHHIIPRAQGGPASLGNLLLLCSFHHLIAVHRWDWAITLHPDGAVTAVSPDRTRTLHDHGPPHHGPPARAA
jgi:Domain of unknown function (DUF222)/HNH endonuclease